MGQIVRIRTTFRAQPDRPRHGGVAPRPARARARRGLVRSDTWKGAGNGPYPRVDSPRKSSRQGASHGGIRGRDRGAPRLDGERAVLADHPRAHPRPGARAEGHRAAGVHHRRDAAARFYARLRELFAEGKSITSFGPYSPGQIVQMKRAGIEGIYLGGWATSAKGSTNEDPGPDLASYPLSQVPDEAAGLVRALLTADKNQRFAAQPHDGGRAGLHPRGGLPPVPHRRRRHRPRR